MTKWLPVSPQRKRQSERQNMLPNDDGGCRPTAKALASVRVITSAITHADSKITESIVWVHFTKLTTSFKGHELI